jgi:Ca2+-binding EF-hand superfamily protein
MRPAGTTVLSAGQPYRTVAAPQAGVTYRTVGPQGTYITTQPSTTVISAGTTVSGNYSLGQYAAQAYEVKHQDDPQLKNLKDLRSSCGLKYVPVGEGLKALKGAAMDNKLTRDVFIDAYSNLLKAYGIEVPAESVKNAVFDLFDRDDNGVVDMMELICGISLLCQGSEEDKIHAVFEIFDENGDGFISMDEMFKFLTSVFKVVLTPNVMGVMRSMGVEVESAEDLASVTALECFKAADLNQDGKLSITEFKEWFYAPKNDPSFLFSPMRKLLQ